jgi:hypothetical protein
MSGIGRLNETELHEQLKHRYAGSEGRTEAVIDGFVVDVVTAGELVEIQTKGFGKLRRKLGALAHAHRFRIVHPIAVETIITRLSDTGELLSTRRSPRHGRLEEVFREIVSIADLLPTPNITVEVVLVRATEIRVADGKGSWRRRGVSIVARQLGAVVSTTTLCTRTDYLSLLPDGLPTAFANSDLVSLAGMRYRDAQPLTSSLRKMGLLHVCNKRGREHLYEIVPGA